MAAHFTIPGWAEALRDRLRPNVPLAPLTTLKIGGPAEWYYPAHTPGDLIAAITAARAAGVPVTLLGDGSNVLVSDRGIRGLIVHNRADRVERRGNDLHAESGALLAELVTRSQVEGLTGLEFASGIYGTVGGAVFGNAGAYGRSMADILTAVEVLTADGEVVSLSPDDLGFGYRRSACGDRGWVIIACGVHLTSGDGEAVGREIARILAIRASKLPADLPSAGSYFRNVEDPAVEHGRIPAGRLLEEVGAKSLRVGGAAVYRDHANVIVNLGGATAADVLALAEAMKGRVRERFGIELVSEVRFLGEPLD